MPELGLPYRIHLPTTPHLPTLAEPDPSWGGTGLLPNLHYPKQRSFRHDPRTNAMIEAGPPTAFSMRNLVNGILNQGQTPRCASYSAAETKSVEERIRDGGWYHFDPDLLFREGGGSDASGGSSDAMCGVMQNIGALRTDTNIRYKIQNYLEAPQDAAGFVVAVKAAIAAQRPVILDLLLPTGWSGHSTGVPTQGYHAVSACLYDADGVGGPNSWGPNWGDNGFYWVSWDYLVQNNFLNGYNRALLLTDVAAPSPVPAPTPTPTPTPTPGGFVQQVLDLTNQARAAAGLGPLRLQSQLTASAQGYAIQLSAGIPFDHTGPDGSTPFSRMHAAGYSGGTMGENIARGFATPQDVMTAWMNSPGHRANILYPTYQHIGIGIAGDSWVQDFGAGGSDDGGPTPPPPPVPPTPPVPPIPPPPASLTVGVNATASGIAVTINQSLPVGTVVNVGVREPDGTTASGTATVGGVTPPTPVPPVPPVPPTPPVGPLEIDIVAPEPVVAGGLLTIRGSGFGVGPGRTVFFPGVLGRLNFWDNSMVQIFVPLSAGKGPNLMELDTANGQKVTKIITVI